MEIKNNILIIGNNPSIISGVTNYTRPLGEQLLESGVNVSHLFSSSYAAEIDFRQMRLEKYTENNITHHKLINSKGLVFNYDQLDIDYSNWFNFKFKNLLKENKINIIHIHEMIGISSDIIKTAKSMNIKVFVTVHEYWWLCPHKVMVDFNGKICEGPTDRKKCAYCIHKKLPFFNTRYLKNNYRIKTVFPFFHKLLSTLKKLLVKDTHSLMNLNPRNEKIKINESTKKINPIAFKRLKKNIEALNLADKVICVSNDVKKNLTKYGVNKNKCLVNHIGSTIASSARKIITKKINKNKINFGFIGGVGYYKGLHLLIKAYDTLSSDEKSKCSVNIYGNIVNNYKDALNNLISQIDPKYRNKVKLHGKFKRNQLDKICNSFDIAVLPSLCADTAPQTIFESFSYKIPIIAPNIGGFPDFVKHLKNGLIFKPGDHESLSSMMKIIIKNPYQISIFKKKIYPSKTMEQNTNELIKLYKLDSTQ